MNLQEKLSGLKGLVTHAHGRRRHKADLTADMISPPLGDFRHTMHVGRGGDVFGDTSFLSNHGGTANGGVADADSLSPPDSKIGAFFSRTLRQIRRGSDSRPRDPAKELSPPPPAVSPIIKNAVSLPRLDVDVPNGSPVARMLFPSCQSSPEEGKSSYGLDSGFVTLPRLSRSDRQQPSASPPPTSDLHSASLTDGASPRRFSAFSDSLPSLTSLDAFTFDLGPSLMSEVFGLIDGRRAESPPAVFSVDFPPEEDCGYKEEERRGGGGAELSARVPDVLIGSADRVGVRMESERFQSAADALARHYRVNPKEAGGQRARSKVSYSFTDDEDEIKV